MGMCVSLFSGCSEQVNSASNDTKLVNTNQATDSGDALKVVTTIYPLYDWTKELADGQNVDLTLLISGGVDLHSYQPTFDDIIKIKEADIIIYLGSSSDSWVEDAFKDATNPDIVILNAMEIVGSENLIATEFDCCHVEPIVVQAKPSDKYDECPGCDGEDECEIHGDSFEEEVEIDHEECDIDHGDSVDEHIWLSLENAVIVCEEITNTLGEVDNTNKLAYESNLANYKTQLSDLDEDFKNVVAEASLNTLLFGDRFPFRYFVESYGLEYYAAFDGCTAETEASFETVVLLTETLNELELPVVLTIENPQHTIAETIIAGSNYPNTPVLVLHSLQSINNEDINSGATYLSIMTDNLEVLTQALN